MELDQYRISQEKQDLIKKSLLETYFKDQDKNFLDSEYGKNDVNANVNQRYLRSLYHIIPWVAKHLTLTGKKLIEIGCGTGSSTAAFAQFVRSITAYDIDIKSLDAAKDRLDILGIDNVSFNLVNSDNLIHKLKINHSKNSVEIILLFAVLEHMTIQERHEAIIACWDLLSADGVLVVVETPNLLQYFDSHTSVLPFFHMLHSDLCAQYAHKSPRNGFNNQFTSYPDSASVDLEMARWGRGVSYHDFELTIGPKYARHIIANGYEPEIMSWFPINIEEDLLRYYISQKKYNIPEALQCGVLNLIFRKSVDDNMPQTQFAAPPISITDSSFRKNYLDCTIQLSKAQQTIDEILSSKRWKIGNLIGSPYRIAKKFFLKKEI